WLEASADGPDRDPWLVVAGGRLGAGKGHLGLLGGLSPAGGRWRLVIAGEGPQSEELEASIAELGLSNRVTLLGHVGEREVEAWVRRAAVCALACVEGPDGDRDGVPVALMEAMAASTPVLTTSVGGI